MGRREQIVLSDDAIIFEDDDLVAVDKASGVLCDASIDEKRDHLGSALKRWADDDRAEFHPAHRLDLGTSGVVLFARHREVATALMHQFQERTVTKQYHAIVHLPGHGEWTAGHSFERVSHLRHRKGKSDEVRSGGKRTETRFEVVSLDGSLALVHAFPATGRTHQLRVHLAAVDAPIAGDQVYGQPAFAYQWPRGDAGFWLHAHVLSLNHPATGEPLVLESPRGLEIVNGGPAETTVDE